MVVQIKRNNNGIDQVRINKCPAQHTIQQRYAVTNGEYSWFATLPLMGLALVVSYTMEVLLPYNADWNRTHGDGVRDFLHFIVNESMRHRTTANYRPWPLSPATATPAHLLPLR